jgi:DNA-binding Lrp family transcriptional regulator
MATKAKPRARRKAGNDAIDYRVKALSHHTRRKILAHLTNVGPDSPSRIARAVGEKTMDVNYHVRKLVDFGCAELVGEKSEPGRPPAKVYRATERYLVDTSEWEALDPAMKEGASGEWAQLFIDELEEGFRAGTLGTHEYFALLHNRITVDEAGRKELIDLAARSMEEAIEIQARALGRLEDGAQEIRMAVLQAAFEVPVDN